MKHRLLRVVQRLFQYQVLLTGGPQGSWGAKGDIARSVIGISLPT